MSPDFTPGIYYFKVYVDNRSACYELKDLVKTEIEDIIFERGSRDAITVLTVMAYNVGSRWAIVIQLDIEDSSS